MIIISPTVHEELAQKTRVNSVQTVKGEDWTRFTLRLIPDCGAFHQKQYNPGPDINNLKLNSFACKETAKRIVTIQV